MMLSRFLALPLLALLVTPLSAGSAEDPHAEVRSVLQAELEDFSVPGWQALPPPTPGPAVTEYRKHLVKIAGTEKLPGLHRMGRIPLVRAGFATEKLGVNVFWPEGPTPKGTVLFVHGYLSHAANFAYTFDFFLRRGWVVVTVDLPGHGLSTGTRGDVDSFAAYGDAVQTWLDWVWNSGFPGPRVLVAHSLGTAASLEALRRPGAHRPDRIVFCAPLLRTDWFPVLSLGADGLGWWMKKMPSTFGWDGYLDGYEVPLHWVQALSRWLDALKFQRPLDLPLAIYSGDRDAVVDEGWNRTEYQRLVPGARYTLLPGKDHLFLSETNDREAFHRRMLADLEATLPLPPE